MCSEQTGAPQRANGRVITDDDYGREMAMAIALLCAQ